MNSYEIHLKQCKDLWVARENTKDPRERKPLPVDPLLLAAAVPSKQQPATGMDSRKQAPQTRVGSSQSGKAAIEDLVPSRLSLEEMNRLAAETFNNVSMDTCEFCGRSFLQEKLPIHNKSCTAEHPARRVEDPVRRGAKKYEASLKEEDDSTPVTRPQTSSKRVSIRGDPEGGHLEITKLAGRRVADEHSQAAASGKPERRPAQLSQSVDVVSLRTEESSLVPVEGGKSIETPNTPVTPVVGHFGGLSGRELRDVRGTEKHRKDVKEISKRGASRAIAEVTRRLDAMEASAAALAKEIKLVRDVLEELTLADEEADDDA